MRRSPPAAAGRPGSPPRARPARRARRAARRPAPARLPRSALVGLKHDHSSAHDLLAVEQLGRHPLGLELRAQRVDPAEVLAHRPAVRGQRALERRRRQLPPAPVRERGARDVLARKERNHHVVVDLDRGLAVGVQPQRLLERRVQPPARQRQRVARTALPARRRPRTRLDLAPALADAARPGSPAGPRRRPGSARRRAAGRSAAGTCPPPSRAPRRTSAAGSPAPPGRSARTRPRS